MGRSGGAEKKEEAKPKLRNETVYWWNSAQAAKLAEM